MYIYCAKFATIISFSAEFFMPNIIQSTLEHKLSLFLAYAGENEHFDEGICNGLAFMNFRADFLGLEEQNLIRMQKLMDTDDSAIEEMAKLYKDYKEIRQRQTESLLSLNADLQKKTKQLDALQKAGKHSANLQHEIDRLKAMRDFYFNIINEILVLTFEPHQLEKIREAEDIYAYLHMLVAASDPSYYHYEVKGNPQKAYVELLQLLAPIDAKESDLQVNKAFEIAFNFTELELVNLFSNDRIIHVDDYIALGSGGHAMYLSYRDGIFRLFDPGPIDIQENTPVAVVAAIKERFYTRHKVDTEYMSIGISVFEKEESYPRPEAVSLIEDILAERGPEHNVNETNNLKDHTSAVFMAAKFGHASVIELLTKMGKLDVNGYTDQGNIPAIVAADFGFEDVVEVLFECKADINKQHLRTSETPLHAAIQSSQLSVIKTLIHCGARFDIKDQHNKTPLDYADKKTILFIELQNDLQKIEEAFKVDTSNRVTFHFASSEEAIKEKQKKLRDDFMLKLDQYASMFSNLTSKLQVYHYYQQSPVFADKTGALNPIDEKIKALKSPRPR